MHRRQVQLDLFLTFAKIGLFTFGGGYAMISLIENACEEKKQWIYDPAELFPTDDSRLDSPRHDGGAAVYFGSRKISRKGISPIGLIGIPAAAGIVAYEIKG